MKITMTLEDLPGGGVDVDTEFDPALDDKTHNTTAFMFMLISQQAIRQFIEGEYKLEEDEALDDGKSG